MVPRQAIRRRILLSAPRTRGDGPTYGGTAGIWPMCSPCPRGRSHQMGADRWGESWTPCLNTTVCRRRPHPVRCAGPRSSGTRVGNQRPETSVPCNSVITRADRIRAGLHRRPEPGSPGRCARPGRGRRARHPHLSASPRLGQQLRRRFARALVSHGRRHPRRRVQPQQMPDKRLADVEPSPSRRG